MLANDIRNYRRMDDYIAHHGILGQKWGVRRFQDKNGRLTAEGKKRRSEYYDNGLKKPKGKLVIHKEVGSDLTDAGKQFKKDVENHVVDFYASMPDDRLKKIRDTYSEYKSLDTKWRATDDITDKELKKLNELEKEWDDMRYNLTKECMGKTFVASNPEWDKDAYDIAWNAHHNTSHDIYEGADPKAIKSERERWDRFNRWAEKEKELYNTNPEYKKTEDRLKDLRHQIDTIELEIVSTDVTKERREALEKKAESLGNEMDELRVKTKEIKQKEMPEFYHSDLAVEVYSAICDGEYLAHHGILGQKWGKKNGPPYPLAAGSHSSSEKKAASAAGVKVGKSSGRGSSEGLNITQSGQKEKPSLIGSMIEGAKNAKLNKQRKQALEKAREVKAKKAEEKAAAEAHEAERKKALDSGDYKEIQKYANESSYEELQRAVNKANVMQQLNQKVVDSTPVEPTLMDKIDKAADMVGKATNAATKGIGAWNKFAEVYNTFADPDSMLPEIGKNWSEEKEKRLKAKEKEVKEAEEKIRKERVEEITKKLDPKLVMKNQKMFTKDELQEANNRLVTYSQLKEKADAIDKEKADAKAKELADKQKKQAEKAEAKAKKESEAQQAKERAKNDYLEEIENRQYNFGDDDSGFKASNPTFKKAVKEAYDYFDNDSVWGSTSISSSINSSSPKSSNTESTKKVVTDVFEYLNSNTDSRYSAPPAWQSILQSSLDEYK